MASTYFLAVAALLCVICPATVFTADVANAVSPLPSEGQNTTDQRLVGRNLLDAKPAAGFGATVNVNIDAKDFANLVQAIIAPPARDAFVLNILAVVTNKFPQYYTLICNMNQGQACIPNLAGGPNSGYPAYTSKQYIQPGQNIQYGVWTFRQGTLNHCGADGGFINWAWSSGGDRFDKNGRSSGSGCIVKWSLKTN